MVYLCLLEKTPRFYIRHMQMAGRHKSSGKSSTMPEAIPSGMTSSVRGGEGSMCLEHGAQGIRCRMKEAPVEQPPKPEMVKLFYLSCFILTPLQEGMQNLGERRESLANHASTAHKWWHAPSWWRGTTLGLLQPQGCFLHFLQWFGY